MKIDLQFNEKFVNELKTKIPKKILDFDIENKFAYKFGYVRFDDNKLNAVYLYTNKENKKDHFPPLIKFDYVNGEFVFKYVYLYLSTGENGELYEARYDSEMNLNSKYLHFTEKVRKDDGLFFCKKIENNNKPSDFNYIYFEELKDFTNFFNVLEEKEIVVNNDKLNNKCLYGIKEDTDAIYLIFGEYDGVES